MSKAWRFVTAWPRALVRGVRIGICALNDEQGRRGWAMLAALGCCTVMSVEFVFSMWQVRKFAMLTFWMGMSAQCVNLIVVTGLMVLLGVRRKTQLDIPLPGGGKASLGIDDQGQPVVVTSTPVPAPAPAAVAAVAEAAAAQPPIK